MPQKPSPHSSFFLALLVAFAAIGIFLLLFQSHRPSGGRAVGTPMPPIKAMGWLNGPEPTADELKGKVLVIDAWASWCGPCRRSAPEMVALYEKYHSQGVEFIGLSMETEESLEAMEHFLKQTGITWKNGYGAEQTLNDLGADYIPMVWVVDRQNNIVWNHGSALTLEQGIREALAAKE